MLAVLRPDKPRLRRVQWSPRGHVAGFPPCAPASGNRRGSTTIRALPRLNALSARRNHAYSKPSRQDRILKAQQRSVLCQPPPHSRSPLCLVGAQLIALPSLSLYPSISFTFFPFFSVFLSESLELPSV